MVQNAIRHNVENGNITISIQGKTLIISNTGTLEPLNQNTIFERFEKKSTNINSIGLGLAIVKEIAVANAMAIAYKFEDNEHVFLISQLENQNWISF